MADAAIINDKFRNKRDLLEYLQTQEGVLVPQIRYCRLSFLQGILSDEKNHILRANANMFYVHQSCAHYAPKNVWPMISQNKLLKSYLPADEMDLGRYPDRNFFWAVLATKASQWTLAYHKQVQKIKASQKQEVQTKHIVISDSWMKKLKQHDFTSRSKRGKQSILVAQQILPSRQKKEDDKRKQVKLYLGQNDAKPLQQKPQAQAQQNLGEHQGNDLIDKSGVDEQPQIRVGSKRNQQQMSQSQSAFQSFDGGVEEEEKKETAPKRQRQNSNVQQKPQNIFGLDVSLSQMQVVSEEADKEMANSDEDTVCYQDPQNQQ